MSRTVYHVVPRTRGQWGVKKENAEKASTTEDSKQEAIDSAKELAKKNKPSQIIIHKKDGSFQTEHTYGSDPERYKG